jgi:hypothetical protein
VQFLVDYDIEKKSTIPELYSVNCKRVLDRESCEERYFTFITRCWPVGPASKCILHRTTDICSFFLIDTDPLDASMVSLSNFPPEMFAIPIIDVVGFEYSKVLGLPSGT